MSNPRLPTVATQDIVRRHSQAINKALQKTGQLAYDGAVTIVSSDWDLASGKVYKINSVQVVGPRQTGWAADTGTAKKTTQATYAAGAGLTYSAAYVQAELTATGTRIATMETALQNASQTIKALKDALILHGLIGA